MSSRRGEGGCGRERGRSGKGGRMGAGWILIDMPAGDRARAARGARDLDEGRDGEEGEGMEEEEDDADHSSADYVLAIADSSSLDLLSRDSVSPPSSCPSAPHPVTPRHLASRVAKDPLLLVGPLSHPRGAL
eukprot:27152-Hanusia_phi.AAC.1